MKSTDSDDEKSGGPYTEAYTSIWMHWKFQMLMKLLKLPRDTVFGKLHLLWHSQVASNETGELRGWDARRLAAVMDWDGPPDDLARALVDAAWIEPLADGAPGYQMVKWHVYGAKFLSIRAGWRERKANAAAVAAATTGKKKGKPKSKTSTGVPAEVSENSHLNKAQLSEAQLIQPSVGESAAAPEPPPPKVKPEIVPPDTIPSTALVVHQPQVLAPERPPSTVERIESRESRNVVAAAHREQFSHRRAAAEAINGRPQTVDALLALRVVVDPRGVCSLAREGDDHAVALGDVWRRRFEALDGRSGRPTVAEKILNLWEYAEQKSWGINGVVVLGYLVGKLAEDNNKFRPAWLKDGGMPRDVAEGDSKRRKLWEQWRRLKDADVDVPGFDDWCRKQEELGSDGQKGSGGTIAGLLAQMPKPSSEADHAAAREFFESAKKPKKAGSIVGKVVPGVPADAVDKTPAKKPLMPEKEKLDAMLPEGLRS